MSRVAIGEADPTPPRDPQDTTSNQDTRADVHREGGCEFAVSALINSVLNAIRSYADSYAALQRVSNENTTQSMRQ